MGVIDKVRGVLQRRKKTYAYECGACGHEFESTEPILSKVNCPECGSGLVNENVG